MAEPTLLRVLLTARHWQRWPTFEAQFHPAAARLAEQEGEPSLAKAAVSERSFERWYSGGVKSLPRPDACRVLEFMFGHPVAELLSPVTAARRPAYHAWTLAPYLLKALLNPAMPVSPLTGRHGSGSSSRS